MATIQKSDNSNFWRGGGAAGGNADGAATSGDNLTASMRLNVLLPYDPEIAVGGIYLLT